uniref:Uncharacterized protein n=1 Tax=Rhizophora mucronata TaxID=61149 RepID=A0A2P2QVS7_RHIMU
MQFTDKNRESCTLQKTKVGTLAGEDTYRQNNL